MLGGSPAETYDRPLTATIDELRIWNATMTANQLKKQRKQRLTGTEPGLAAYYPFEVKTLNAQNQVVTNGSAADLSGSGKEAELFYYTSSTPQLLNYSDDAPALREKPSEENVNFTFTASDNKIVITLDEAPARVEGTTLSVTVRDVHDQNGNLSEPVTWTAFVSQNPLAWKEASVCCDCVANTGSTLTAALVNKSGTAQSWTLNGLPAWLTADVDYGQLQPLGEQVITFTVSPSTPIGKYERTVYVKGNDGIDTPLTLCVTVTGDTPDWAVNSSSYELSMNLIGRVSILGTPSDDADDIVAAFVGDECRGVAQPEYNEYYDAYFVTMDIYGNGDEGSDPITFKVYDASTGITYPVVITTLPGQTAPSAILFETDNLLGRYQSPVLLDATDEVEQSIALNNGWNWMSLSVECGDMTVPVVFAKAGGKVDMVKSHTGGFAMHNHDSGQWLGSLSEMSSSKMYAVQTNDAFTLSVTGHRIVTSEVPVTVEEGWNWVGYNAQGLMSVADALAGMAPQEGDIIKAQQGVAYYSSNRWNGSLKTLTPGKGYKISSTVARSFAYPSVTAAGARTAAAFNSRGDRSLSSEEGLWTPIDYCLYPSNMVLIAQVVGEASKLCSNDPVGEVSKRCDNQPLAGIELGIFAGDECRAAAITDDEGMVYITIPGDEPCKLTFRVADGNSEFVIRNSEFVIRNSEFVIRNSEFVIRNSELRYETDAVIGTPKAPFVIDLGEATDVQSVATQSQQTEQVYDLQGRKIVNRKFENRKLNKGVYIINGQKKVK